MHWIKRLKRAAHRAWFRFGGRGIKLHGKLLRLPPKIKGRQLILKRSANEIERQARKAMMQQYTQFPAAHYTLRLSKRYPSIQHERVELFENFPTLYELRQTPLDLQTQFFVRSLPISESVLRELINKVILEIVDNARSIYKSKHIRCDFNSTNFLVTGVHEGKLELVMVDG